MMNMMDLPAMNRAISEDVNAPALRNPMNHLRGSCRKQPVRRAEKPGWIDAIRAAHRRG